MMANRSRLPKETPITIGSLEYTATIDSILRSTSNPMALLNSFMDLMKAVFSLNRNRQLTIQKIAALKHKVSRVEADINAVHQKTTGKTLDRLR
jgi:hypothetical protein